jgi:ATP-dependent DNA helicase RecQ
MLDDLLPRREAKASRAKKEVEPDLDADPQTVSRFEKLRAVRMQLARDRQLPPYCICHDSTLKIIALEKPADNDALERIKGMGPMKVKLYGPALLQAITGL